VSTRSAVQVISQAFAPMDRTGTIGPAWAVDGKTDMH
jgi:hypothetical protein